MKFNSDFQKTLRTFGRRPSMGSVQSVLDSSYQGSIISQNSTLDLIALQRESEL